MGKPNSPSTDRYKKGRRNGGKNNEERKEPKTKGRENDIKKANLLNRTPRDRIFLLKLKPPIWLR
jgi:hypothetical protein